MKADLGGSMEPPLINWYVSHWLMQKKSNTKEKKYTQFLKKVPSFLQKFKGSIWIMEVNLYFFHSSVDQYNNQSSLD